MSRTILLDSGPLGLVTNPNAPEQAIACGQWLVRTVDGGSTVMVPEIADYEVRRELIRARRLAGIKRLDGLIDHVGYLAITTSAMRRAAQLWAKARQRGQPTASDAALDGDVILAAQAMTLNGSEVIVATTNTRHLERFVTARLWTDIH